MQVEACRARVYDTYATHRLLRSQSVLFIGDSVIRNIALALFRLLQTPQNAPPPVMRHGDMVFHASCGVTAEFRWRPYAENVSEKIREWRQGRSTADSPLAALVTGVALWDVLHIRNNTGYDEKLLELSSILHDVTRAVWSRTSTPCDSSRLYHLCTHLD
jgi:hypothetical protein